MMVQSIAKKAWQKIKLVVLDFDGILNNGYVYLASDGTEINRFSHIDGKGVDLLKELGIIVYVLSGQVNKIVKARCGKMAIPFKSGRRFKSAEGKLSEFKLFLAKHNLRPEESLYMGDDVNDLLVLDYAGLGITVPNAHRLVLKRCKYTTRSSGGDGAIREVVDLLIDAQKV